MPGAGHGAQALRQLVEVRPNLHSMSDTWRAEATLEPGAGPSDKLHIFAPFEIVRADYCPSIELTMPLGRVLAEL
jgi:hypothetical protein